MRVTIRKAEKHLGTGNEKKAPAPVVTVFSMIEVMRSLLADQQMYTSSLETALNWTLRSTDAQPKEEKAEKAESWMMESPGEAELVDMLRTVCLQLLSQNRKLADMLSRQQLGYHDADSEK